MEFHEKLLELRKQRGLTQEELAQALYISRTAVSKWESGRGYPSIDSLKAIARFFCVTVDDLLSGDEVLTIAEEDNRQKETFLRDLVFGILDLSTAALLFLPAFRQKSGHLIDAVSLLNLTETAPYIRTAFFLVVIGIVTAGVLTLPSLPFRHAIQEKIRRRLSFLLNGAGMLLFTLSLQPYAATLLFIFLTVKVLLLSKRR